MEIVRFIENCYRENEIFKRSPRAAVISEKGCAICLIGFVKCEKKLLLPFGYGIWNVVGNFSEYEMSFNGIEKYEFTFS